MFLGEPPPTQADVHFRLFGFPVRVHPFFWLATIVLQLGGGQIEPVRMLVWIGVVFVSILVHELGHAFLQRRFGGRPHIVLHGFGGLAICGDCDRSPRSQILISLAGPAAGFLFALVVMIGVWLTGHAVSVTVLGLQLSLAPSVGVRLSIDPQFVLYSSQVRHIAAPMAYLIIQDLLYVNILWGLINLLPVYPLDGGQVAREVLTLRNPQRGIVLSLQLSIATAAAMALYELSHQATYTCIMFALLAYGSYQALRAYQNYWR